VNQDQLLILQEQVSKQKKMIESLQEERNKALGVAQQLKREMEEILHSNNQIVETVKKRNGRTKAN
jgi:peptidoglycan hydrolase CwlO-like protein